MIFWKFENPQKNGKMKGKQKNIQKIKKIKEKSSSI